MSAEHSMLVRFWGVRGSIASPGARTARYGGNTPCVEVRCGDDILILDGGTGIRALGTSLMRSGSRIDADIFLSHCHLDHISGLPFFAPFFAAGHRLRLWAGNLLPTFRLEEVVRKMISPPLFPIQLEVFRADIEYRDFRAGEVLNPRPGVTLRTALLDHPDGATGYRIEHAGKVLSYLTDMELRAGGYEPRLLELARGADLMIYDCTYTEAELAARAGWGHSTWQQGVRLAEAAGVKTFCLFHHDPEHDDAFMDVIAEQASAARPGSVVAREGLEISL
jgi:phosphoribosyl 1,2-cyclic phosphodiesterase